MPSQDRDVIDKIGRTLVVAFLIYLTTFLLLFGSGMSGVNTPPLLAIFLGFFLVFAGFTLYYYRNPEEAVE
ncbi:hypothetical protein GCM10028857_01900 [Salinarchaeum chitinilyticum]